MRRAQGHRGADRRLPQGRRPARFSCATAGIRLTFGTPENFMEPVPLGDDDPVQPVRLTDAEGRSWMALYPMQRGPDGVWRTNGCQLRRLGQET